MSTNPYEPPKRVEDSNGVEESGDAPRTRGLPVWLVVMILLVNLGLGALPYISWIGSSYFGIYAFEYIVLLTWFAWSDGNTIRRLAIVAWIGTLWMLASWGGYALTRSAFRFYTWEQELLRMFNNTPLAFVLSSIPLLLMRRNWKFQSGRTATSFSKASAISLVPILACIFFSYVRARSIGWELFASLLIGVILGSIACVMSTLLSVALLGPRVRYLAIVMAAIMGTAPGFAAGSMYAAPPIGRTVALPAAIASLVAFVPLLLVFTYWRQIGIRKTGTEASL